MRFLLSCILLLGVLFPAKVAADPLQKVADKVLSKLYNAVGNKMFLKPSVSITTCETQGKCFGAKYDKYNDEIVIETQLYKVCQSFGKDSLDALAFILGHELGHYYKEKLSSEEMSTSFLAYDKNFSTDIRKEKLADVQGIFTAYLAGYKTISIIPDLLDQFYDAYGLKGKNLFGYPSLKQRQLTTKEVLGKVNTLIEIFEMAGYLSVVGEYEAAIASYEHLLQYYEGPEIFNNMGVCYALEALNFTDSDFDHFLFPLELDVQSRLSKSKMDKDITGFSLQEMMKRRKLLDKAEMYLKKSGRLDPSYVKDELNLLCVYVLQWDYNKANNFIATANIDRKLKFTGAASFEKARYRLIKGILKANTEGQEEEAKRIFSELSVNENELIAFKAAYNLKIMLEEKTNEETVFSCYLSTSDEKSRIDGVDISKVQPKETFKLGEGVYEMEIRNYPKSKLLFYTKASGEMLVFQRMNRAAAKNNTVDMLNPNAMRPSYTVDASDGYFMYCPDKKLVYKSSANDRVTEWGKFVKR